MKLELAGFLPLVNGLSKTEKGLMKKGKNDCVINELKFIKQNI